MEARLIKTEAEYDAALARIDALLDAEPGTPEEDELELLSILVEAYEDRHYPMSLPSPGAAIKFHMEQEGLAEGDMVVYFGSLMAVKEVLSGTRDLSLEQIRNLHNELGIPAEALIASQVRPARPAA